MTVRGERMVRDAVGAHPDRHRTRVTSDGMEVSAGPRLRPAVPGAHLRSVHAPGGTDVSELG